MRATLSGDGSRAPAPALSSERIAEELAELRAEHAGQLADLRAENARLAAKVDQLDARRDAPEHGRGSSAQSRGWRRPRNEVLDSPEPVSRRRVFGMLGSAAAAGAGLAVAGSALAADPAGATVVTAGAANLDALAIGVSNSCTNQTMLMSGTNNGGGAFNVGASGVNGVGIVGQCSNGSDAVGVIGLSSSGVGLVGVGAKAPLYLEASVFDVGAPTTLTHRRGEFFVDSAGVLFYCVANGTPGTWVRQAPLVTLASPVRVYDSRAGQPNQAPNVQGTLAFTSAPPSANNRVIRCAKDASSGVTVIPAGATTLLLNLTAIAVSGVGALSVYADGAAQPATSNLNWTAGGQIAANSVTSACDAAQDIRVAIPAGAGAVCNFIVDVFGYYL